MKNTALHGAEGANLRDAGAKKHNSEAMTGGDGIPVSNRRFITSPPSIATRKAVGEMLALCHHHR